jgi:hypothetical protein
MQRWVTVKQPYKQETHVFDAKMVSSAFMYKREKPPVSGDASAEHKADLWFCVQVLNRYFWFKTETEARQLLEEIQQ